ncbi:MAG: acyl-CoA synthetase, partial [Candidatus Methanosuratincola sp.]
GFAYASVMWGIWRAGGVAVPLSPSHPAPELEYVVTDSEASCLICEPTFLERVRPIAAKRGIRILTTLNALSEPRGLLAEIEPERRAMILYTSGTTSKPKGVVSTHSIITAQIESIVEAWEWSQEDRTLLVLPLHHLHGILNVLSCALWSGATVEILPRFDAVSTWEAIASGRLTIFMAVPTIYSRLISFWESSPQEMRKEMSDGARRMRVMISGSAALPVPMLERWKEITGHTLLERYGMTEIGMALTNPLRGERRAGYVGTPFPGVELRLVDDSGELVGEGEPGEIEVRGRGIFLEYWRNPAATLDAFRDGWFRTGDIAQKDGGIYRILGRKSTDIIKKGGFKVSALEVEHTLLSHPDVKECAVVGIPDPEWGEIVCAAVVTDEGGGTDVDALRSWAMERLAKYKVPSRIIRLGTLPRNEMGKVIKPRVASLFRLEGQR